MSNGKQLVVKKRKPGPGRPKGGMNKTTASAKQNLMDVFEMLGGAEGFYDWAKENRSEFYRHYAKLIPTDVKLEGTVNLGLGDVAAAIKELRRLRDS